MASLIRWAGKQFGSDVYTHYTAVYTWNSNQMAHAMMGFAGTTLFIHAATRLGLDYWYGAFFYLLPLLKDVTDVIADHSVCVHQFKMKEAHRREIWLDALTDNFFWTAGLMLALFVVAASFEDRHWWSCLAILAAFLILITGVLVAKRHFNEQKKRFDVSGLPYYFRLPCYPGNLVAPSDSDSSKREPVKEVEDFVYKQAGKNVCHLLIYGPPRSFKTTLAVAIGSGLTVRHQAVRYLSKLRLIKEYTPDIPADGIKTGSIPPHKADVVIIDDLDSPDGLREIFPSFVEKSTVWIVSSSSSKKLRNWKRFIDHNLSGPLVTIKLEPSQRLCENLPLLVNVFSVITLLVSSISIIGAFAVLIAPQLCEFLSICEVPKAN